VQLIVGENPVQITGVRHEKYEVVTPAGKPTFTLAPRALRRRKLGKRVTFGKQAHGRVHDTELVAAGQVAAPVAANVTRDHFKDRRSHESRLEDSESDWRSLFPDARSLKSPLRYRRWVE